MSAAIQALRQQLRDKFPQAHAAWTPPREEEEAATPFEPQAFPSAAISEVVPAAGLSGLSLLVARLLGEPEKSSPLPDFVLIDGGDTFDPASYTAEACSRLLWVRCRGGLETMKAADLLIRDGNVPFVLLDLCGLEKDEMRGIPASTWWRLKLAAEKSGCRVVVLSPAPRVPCASLRVRLAAGFGLQDFELPRKDLLERLRVTPDRLRHVAT